MRGPHRSFAGQVADVPTGAATVGPNQTFRANWQTTRPQFEAWPEPIDAIKQTVYVLKPLHLGSSDNVV